MAIFAHSSYYLHTKPIPAPPIAPPTSLLAGTFRELKVRGVLDILQDGKDYTGKVGELVKKGMGEGGGRKKGEMTKKERKAVNAYERLEKRLGERGGVGGDR